MLDAPASSIEAPGEKPAPLLIDDREAAALCGVSRSHWRTLLQMGRVPTPIRLGRAVRWRREELVAWVAAKCPDAATWEAMQAALRRPRMVS